MHARCVSRRIATGAVTLTLTLGGLAFTGGSATAAPEAADRAASAECQQARKSLSKAKKSKRKAQRQGKAAKVRKAQRRIEVRKERKQRACAPTTEQTVLEQVQSGQLALDGLDLNGLTALLPAELAAVLNQLVAQLEGALAGIGANAPGATPEELEDLLAALQAMDAQGFVSALQGLLGELTEIGGGPDAMATLIELLQGGLPDGGSLPIGGAADLQALISQLAAQLTAAGGFDWTQGPAALAAMFGQLVATLEALSGQVGGGSAPGLEVLTDLIDQLTALGALTPGSLGSADALGAILEGILGELGGGDPLASLQALLGSGGLGALLEGLLDLLGDVLGGLLGGLGAPAA